MWQLQKYIHTPPQLIMTCQTEPPMHPYKIKGASTLGMCAVLPLSWAFVYL